MEVTFAHRVSTVKFLIVHVTSRPTSNCKADFISRVKRVKASHTFQTVDIDILTSGRSTRTKKNSQVL